MPCASFLLSRTQNGKIGKKIDRWKHFLLTFQLSKVIIII
nr:MAG TPA: hypothetical protein [Bacteriophage sp.]